jgi:uncharacterized repeat protein (TIGR04076 family)
MKRMKITLVVKGFTTEELFDGEVPDHFPETFSSPCPIHPEGQEFVMKNLNCPEGFCNCAYANIQKDLARLWIGSPTGKERNPNYYSCTDGRRPVVFKVERIEK